VLGDLQAASSAIAVELVPVGASNSREIDTAFVALAGKQVDALVVGTDSFFFGRRVQITTLATRHGLPSIYNARDYAEAGGLMTYGTNLTEGFRQAGVYAGRILKGEKPADLPVVQSSKFEFIINLATHERSASRCRQRCSRAPTRASTSRNFAQVAELFQFQT
jgi:putative ABC transport system substrate-binding protein